MLNNIIKIKDDEFLELRDIIYANSSIALTPNKKYLIENRLSKRILELNFTSFKEYIYYLKYDANRSKELDTMINLMTINETYFMRERMQIENMVKHVVPELLNMGRKNIRIWSAACSTGEEPYSIAIMLTEAQMYNKADFEIIGTDINSEVIEVAKAGEYRIMSFRGVPEDIQNKYFTQHDNIFNIKEDIKKRVEFKVGNLISPFTPAQLGKFDIIFCRNVIIYFDMEGKQKVVDTFYKMLNTPGYLYLGHSESLSKLSSRYTAVNFGGGMVHIKS